MRLYVIRHAPAEERGPAFPDDELRPLSDDGAERMVEIARGLRQVITGVDELWSSPLLRATQTADILLKHLAAPSEYQLADALRPEALPADVLPVLAASRGTAAIVGHEPHLGRTVTFFLTGQANMPVLELKKGAVAAIQFPGRAEPGAGTLAFLLPPRALRGR